VKLYTTFDATLLKELLPEVPDNKISIRTKISAESEACLPW